VDTSDILNILTKAGTCALPVVMASLLLNYWGVIMLSKVPLPFFVDGLYIYTVVNGAAATPFIYLERRAKLAHGKTCPYCDSILESSINYTCPKHGEITPENK